jgi:hypothetical protein
VDGAALSRELEADVAAVDKYNRLSEQYDRVALECTRRVEDIDAQIERLKHEKAEVLLRKQDHLNRILNMEKPVSNATALRSQIANAETVNNAVSNKVLHGKLSETLAGHEATVAGISKQLEDMDTLKRKSITSAVMPVDGLSFDSEKGELVFTGVPFSQASSAQQIRVAVALAMAKNPKIRLILIRDGSLLDKKSYALLEELAKQYNFLVVLESVMPHSDNAIQIVDGGIVG